VGSDGAPDQGTPVALSSAMKTLTFALVGALLGIIIAAIVVPPTLSWYTAPRRAAAGHTDPGASGDSRGHQVCDGQAHPVAGDWRRGGRDRRGRRVDDGQARANRRVAKVDPALCARRWRPILDEQRQSQIISRTVDIAFRPSQLGPVT
jgi:hypothetical protein